MVTNHLLTGDDPPSNLPEAGEWLEDDFCSGKTGRFSGGELLLLDFRVSTVSFRYSCKDLSHLLNHGQNIPLETAQGGHA